MAELRTSAAQAPGSGVFKEAVCIDARRIYDSCSDKDCVEDIQVMFTEADQDLINQAMNVKAKKVEIIHVYIDVESIPFNRGFYAVDMTFYFHVTLSVYFAQNCQPSTICGLAAFTKKVILFGSEGSVRTFQSGSCVQENLNASGMPVATVQAVDPICLNCCLLECAHPCEWVTNLPANVCSCFEGHFCCGETAKGVFITLGLFTIVQLQRQVQMMVPVYDFCVPEKECVTTTDDPCELFKKIKFPAGEFFPPRMNEDDDGNMLNTCAQ